MQDNNNMNLLGFNDLIFHRLAEDKEVVDIHASVKNMNTCPHCGSKKIWVHDYRIQEIKDTHIQRGIVLVWKILICLEKELCLHGSSDRKTGKFHKTLRGFVFYVHFLLFFVILDLIF